MPAGWSIQVIALTEQWEMRRTIENILMCGLEQEHFYPFYHDVCVEADFLISTEMLALLWRFLHKICYTNKNILGE